MYESGTRLPAPCRRSSPACLSQLVLWLGLVMVVQGGALPSFFGGPSSSTSGTDKPGLPPLVWYVQLPHAAVHVYPSYPRRLYPDEAPGVESKLLFKNPQVFDPHFSCVCMCVLCRFAPFYSGGGYCSEAIAFMQALQQTAPPDTLLAIQQVKGGHKCI